METCNADWTQLVFSWSTSDYICWQSAKLASSTWTYRREWKLGQNGQPGNQVGWGCPDVDDDYLFSQLYSNIYCFMPSFGKPNQILCILYKTLIMTGLFCPNLLHTCNVLAMYLIHQDSKLKKIFRSPCGDQPEKYSRQMQIFSRQFVKCKWRSS